VERTVAVFAESGRVAICTGRVEALCLETEGQRLFEANGGFARGEKRIRLPPQRSLGVPLIARSIGVGSGASLAVRREAIRSLGGFDEALDLGPALPGGGDLDILWRVLAAGHEVVYAPEVRARHEHRRDAGAAVQQILDHNRSLVAFLAKTLAGSRGRERAGVALFLAWRLAKPWLRLARSLVGRDALPVRAAFRLCLACWQGLGTYAETQRIAAAIARDAAQTAVARRPPSP
jgi:GT2 family glycosyltransferase